MKERTGTTGTIRRRYPVRRMNLSINMEKTGENIRRLIRSGGYTVREIMEITGITAEQTVYKWYKGKSIPSLETQIILCRILGIQITDLLVIDEEPCEPSCRLGSYFKQLQPAA